MLAVEVISSTATIGYAILLVKQSRPRPSLGLPLADPNEELDPDNLAFNLRVLIPCYKEKVGDQGPMELLERHMLLLAQAIVACECD